MYTFLNRRISYNKIFEVDYGVSQMEISPTLTQEGRFMIIHKDNYKKVANQHKKAIIKWIHFLKQIFHP